MKYLLTIVISMSFSLYAQQAPETFQNPILPGFHPDPSIILVEDDYYLVNSSFEWFPGLPIYHSKDLVNWQLIGYGIHRPDQVPLPEGLLDSRGTYAPTLRYREGTYYLINTCVRCEGNFYVTASNPAGPWSDPIWTKTRGIDPDLFWDDDGRSYYVGHANISGVSDWPNKNGVWMQEINLETGEMLGDRKQLTHGHATNARWTEGPHLYKIEGKYVLLVAEGGTGFHHAVTAHHSDSLWGPYIPYHSNPVLTHRHLGESYPIQATGHTDIVQTHKGDWWAVMLAKRKINGETLLARETFLTPVEIQNEEGYPLPVFNPGHGKLLSEQQRPDLPWTPFEKADSRDEFNGAELNLYWNFLRSPLEKWYGIKDGNISIQLREEVLDSLVNPSFIAQRIEHHEFSASTHLSFKTKKSNEQAGMAVYRNSDSFFTLLLGNGEVILQKEYKDEKEVIAKSGWSGEEIVLAVSYQNQMAQFKIGKSEGSLKDFGKPISLDILSDEKSGGFNGPYIGMYATSKGKPSKRGAVFDWFEYRKK